MKPIIVEVNMREFYDNPDMNFRCFIFEKLHAAGIPIKKDCSLMSGEMFWEDVPAKDCVQRFKWNPNSEVTK